MGRPLRSSRPKTSTVISILFLGRHPGGRDGSMHSFREQLMNVMIAEQNTS
jgi:hypothetical protein